MFTRFEVVTEVVVLLLLAPLLLVSIALLRLYQPTSVRYFRAYLVAERFISTRRPVLAAYCLLAGYLDAWLVHHFFPRLF